MGLAKPLLFLFLEDPTVGNLAAATSILLTPCLIEFAKSISRDMHAYAVFRLIFLFLFARSMAESGFVLTGLILSVSRVFAFFGNFIVEQSGINL